MRNLFLILLLFSELSYAEIVSCMDEQGKKVFTDNKSICIGKSELKKHLNLTRFGRFYNEVPDLLQTIELAKLPDEGRAFCGPVAVSNSLVWLEGKKDKEHQISVVHKLSSSGYMNTNTKNGTGTTGLIRGVERYVKEVFGGYRELKYSGWRNAPKEYRSIFKQPTIDYMRSALNQNGAAWLNVGWYKYDQQNEVFTRVGGHWVTLVGYESGELVIHDPAPQAGNGFSNEFVSYSEIKTGTLTGNKHGLPQPAKGYYKLGKGMHIPKRADLAVIDGVVVLQI
ncbi:MAG: hypothetical protein PVI97_07950 [Candidatus Thiodiazotropha sp.]|jgi:hypothetical protein